MKNLLFSFIFILVFFLGVNGVSGQENIDRFTLGEVYWAFDGTLTNQNGENIDVLFGVIEISYNSDKGILSSPITYLNFGGRPFFAWQQILGERDTKGKKHLVFDFVPLEIYAGTGFEDQISLITLDIPFNSEDEIISKDEIIFDEIKISEMYEELSQSALEEYRLSEGLYEFSPIDIVSCGKSYSELTSDSSGERISGTSIQCTAYCLDHPPYNLVEKYLSPDAVDKYSGEPLTINDFCHIDNIQLNDITTNDLDLGVFSPSYFLK